MKHRWAFATALVMASAASDHAHAVDGATGVYLLGAKQAMAGYTPPPGTYITDYSYIYSGSTDQQIGIADRVVVGVEADAFINAPVALWIADRKILGGNIGFGVMVPVGWKDISAEAEIDLGNIGLPPIIRRIHDDDTAFGDPLLTALIGWHEGNWHWNLSGLLNIPIGFWERGNLSNLGFNRWALDVTGAATWLDPKTGLELSTAVGFTFNGENLDTDYESGTEFHVEFAAIKHFSKTFSVGLGGYHYQQLTADSGRFTDVIGGFEGRVTALGPVMTYSFNVGKIPVGTELKWLHEFDVKNRLEGDVGMLTVSMPLSASHH
jgi:hypothetical protein